MENHLCLIYEDDADHRSAITSFLRQGLDQGERAICIMDTCTAETVLGYLQNDGVDVNACLAAGKITMLTGEDVGLQGDCIDPDAMMSRLRSETQRAIDERYSGVRVSIEMTWALRGLLDWDQLTSYESKLDKFLTSSKCTMLCQYDSRRVAPEVLISALHTHPLAIIGAVPCKSLYYLPPAELPDGNSPAAKMRRMVQNLVRYSRERELEQECEEKHRSLFEKMISGFALHEIICDENGKPWDYRFLEVNPAFERMTGLQREKVIGKTVREVLPGTESLWIERYGEVALTGEPAHFESYAQALGRYYEVLAFSPAKGQFVVTFQDITERKQAEEKLVDLNRFLSVLSAINQMIVRTHDQTKLFEEACRIPVEAGLFRMAWVGLVDQETQQVKPVVWRGFEEGYLDRISISVRDLPNGRGPTGQAIQRGEHVICQDIEHDPRMTPWREEALKRGYRSSAAFPLRVGDEVIGSLNVYSGEPGYFNDKVVRLLDELAGDIGFAAHFIEQQERREQAEEALRESEARFREIFERAALGIVLIDKRGYPIAANPAFQKMLGYAAEELYTMSFIEFTHPDDASANRELFTELFEGKRDSYELEKRYRRKDGGVVWGHLTASLVRDAEGKPAFAECVVENITERRRAEEEASLIAEDLRQLIDTANAPIFGINAQGLVNEWNQMMELVTGYSKAEVLGRPLVKELLTQNKRAAVQAVLMKALDGQGSRSAEFALGTKDGRRVILLLSATPRRNAEGHIVGVIGVGQDTTELSEYRKSLERSVAGRTRELAEALEREKELTRELQVSLEKQKELVQLKSRFVSMASHEFRTPLSAILSSTDILTRYSSRMTPEQRLERLQKIQQQVYNMTMLLDEVLIIGRADAERLEFRLALLNLPAFCREIMQEIQEADGGKHRFQFVCETPSPMGVFLLDEKLARRIVTNLLSNAVKYSPEGSTVYMDLACDESSATLRVRDEGIGIPKEHLPHLFEPFHRASNVGNIQGTGLGLAILQRAVDLHHGTITVESEVGRGTTFTVVLPRHEGEGS